MRVRWSVNILSERPHSREHSATQWCAGQCLKTDSLVVVVVVKRQGDPVSTFRSVNTPTMSEMCTIAQSAQHSPAALPVSVLISIENAIMNASVRFTAY